MSGLLEGFRIGRFGTALGWRGSRRVLKVSGSEKPKPQLGC